MRKIFLFMFVMFFSGLAFAQAGNDLQVNQWRNIPSGYNSVTVSVPTVGSHGLFYYNFNTRRFRFAQLPPGWDIVSDQLTAPTLSLSAFTNDVGFITDADPRLTDARTPAAHTHDAADVVSGVFDGLRIPDMPVSKITGLQSALDGKEVGGSASAAQAYAVQRSNHTGSQPVSTITGNGYSGTTIKNGLFQINKAAVVVGGAAVFHLTGDGNSAGAALCAEVQQNSVQVTANNPNASYQFGWAFSNANKTITVTANKFTTASLLTGVLGQSAANGDTVYLTVSCI